MKRKLQFKGSWYPSNGKELKKLVKVIPVRDNQDRFGVVPHAGLYYSSSLIKSFFATLNPKIDKILLITPSHYYALEDDTIYSSHFNCYESFFRDIKGFSIEGFVSGYKMITEAEHSVEMILPFIAQRKNLSLCCAHVNKFTDVDTSRAYAKKILSKTDDTTAVVASSDFTHYGSSFNYTPFGLDVNEDVVKKVSVYDRNIAELFTKGHSDKAYFIAAYNDNATICGLAPMLIVGQMAELLNMKGRIIGQSNSLKDNQLDDNFVSYLSLAWR